MTPSVEDVHHPTVEDVPTVFRKRRAQALELGLWPKGDGYEATEKRAELASVGFYDYADDRWDHYVTKLRKERRT